MGYPVNLGPSAESGGLGRSPVPLPGNPGTRALGQQRRDRNWTIEQQSASGTAVLIPGLNTDEVTFTSAMFDNLLDSAYYNNPLIGRHGYNPAPQAASGMSGSWNGAIATSPSASSPREPRKLHGKNDTFEIQGFSIDGAILAVYDRWGNQIFRREL